MTLSHTLTFASTHDSHGSLLKCALDNLEGGFSAIGDAGRLIVPACGVGVQDAGVEWELSGKTWTWSFQDPRAMEEGVSIAPDEELTCVEVMSVQEFGVSNP